MKKKIFLKKNGQIFSYACLSCQTVCLGDPGDPGDPGHTGQARAIKFWDNISHVII